MALKPASAAEKKHMSQVASLGCIIKDITCGGRLELHHPTGAGMAKRASHFDVIPLCFNHHSAQTPLPFGYSVHKGTKTFESRYGTQQELLEKVKSKLQRMI
jgi:hypothetical protein